MFSSWFCFCFARTVLPLLCGDFQAKPSSFCGLREVLLPSEVAKKSVLVVIWGYDKLGRCGIIFPKNLRLPRDCPTPGIRSGTIPPLPSRRDSHLTKLFGQEVVALDLCVQRKQWTAEVSLLPGARQCPWSRWCALWFRVHCTAAEQEVPGAAESRERGEEKTKLDRKWLRRFTLHYKLN